MGKDWVVLYTTSDNHRAHILAGHLAAEGIEVVQMNKQNAAYVGVIGEIELHVLKESYLQARKILENSLPDEQL